MIPAVDRWPRWIPLLLFIGALLAAAARAPRPGAVDFQPPALSHSEARRLIAAHWPNIPQTRGEARQPSLSRGPDGRLALVWLAPGRDETDRLAIWFSAQDRQGQWQTPLEVATRATAAGGAFAHVRHIASPMLQTEGSWLHLWYIGYAWGETRGATLFHTVSTDGGRHWTLPRRLPLSAGPFAGERALDGPRPLGDGGFALPVRAPVDAAAARWLRFDATGRLIDQLPLQPDDPLFQAVPARQLEIPR